MTARGERIGLCAVVGVGVALRVFRLDWGLPGFNLPDDTIHFIRPAMTAAAGGPLAPADYVHPPVLFFVLTAAFRCWSAVTGRAIEAGNLALFTLVGRGVVVGAAGLSIVALHMLGRRLLGARAGLTAAAAFATAPLHVLESHRTAPDVLVILFAVLAVYAALVGRDTRRPGVLAAGFGAAGLAAASKYNGVFAVTAPAWVALRPGADALGARLRLVAVGALAAAGAAAVPGLPCLQDLDRCTRHFRLLGKVAYVVGMPGVDLAAGWTQHRWVYPLVVALPYLVGWPVYLAALAGLVVLWRRNRGAAGVLLAAIVPYVLFLGGGISAVPRYYLFVAPFLALAAAGALDSLGGRARGVVAGAVLGYTLCLSLSQVARLGVGPQAQVGAVVAGLAADATRAGRGPLVVAYPNHFALAYDALHSFLRAADVKVVDFPEPFGHPGTETTPGAAPATDGGGALRARDIDVVVLPSWVENAVRRVRPDGVTARFYDELEAGALGYRPAGDFRRAFLTERLYTWGDPMLDTHWETAIAGYKVFVRDDAS